LQLLAARRRPRAGAPSCSLLPPAATSHGWPRQFPVFQFPVPVRYALFTFVRLAL